LFGGVFAVFTQNNDKHIGIQQFKSRTQVNKILSDQNKMRYWCFLKNTMVATTKENVAIKKSRSTYSGGGGD